MSLCCEHAIAVILMWPGSLQYELVAQRHLLPAVRDDSPRDDVCRSVTLPDQVLYPEEHPQLRPGPPMQPSNAEQLV